MHRQVSLLRLAVNITSFVTEMKLFFAYGVRLKAVECGELTKQGLIQKFEEIFDFTVPRGKILVIRAYDKDANDYVELDDSQFSDIADLTKLSFLLTGKSSPTLYLTVSYDIIVILNYFSHI